MSAAPAASKPAQPLYFINGPVDFLLIGGLSIITLIAFYVSDLAKIDAYDKTTGKAHIVTTITLWLMVVCNWPHFAASSYRLYQTKSNIRQYPMTALALPWVIIAFALASFWQPLVVAPLFVKLFLVWSPYHFSGQTIGVSLIYFRRAGIRISYWMRLALSTFVYGTFISMSIRAEYGLGSFDYYTIKYPTFGLPDWGRDTFLHQPILSVITEVIMYMGGIAFLGLSALWMKENKRLMPAIVFLPAITQFFWFVVAARMPNYNQMVPFFHSMQYLLIAWSMQMKETLDRKHERPSILFVLKESAIWSAFVLIGGSLLFSKEFGLPKLCMKEFDVSIDFAAGIVLAAVQIHHFFVDGVIWKLKSTSVSSPLMVNIDDLIHEKEGSV
ncbi:MAG: hypothetical protein U0798_09220 [Gemmataceae bacterium]